MSQFKIIKTLDEVHELIQYCKQTKYCSLDFETTGLKYYEKSELPTVLGVSFQIGSAWVIPLAHFDSPFLKNNQWIKVLKLFGKEVLEDWDIVKVAWNLKFEYKWLLRFDITMKGRLFDAMMAKYCLDEEHPHGLKDWVSIMFPKYANYEKEIKRWKWNEVPLEPLSQYCALDCDLTLRMMVYFEGRLIKLGFYELFRSLLMMAVRDLAEMESHGMLVDRDYLLNLMESYGGKIEKVSQTLDNHPNLVKYKRLKRKQVIHSLIKDIELEIAQIQQDGKPNAPVLIKNRLAKINRIKAGEFAKKEEEKMGFNWGSPIQVKDFFFGKNGLKLPKRDSTDEATLLDLESKDKTGVIKTLLEFRALSKLSSTYVTGMYNVLSTKDRVHASYHMLTVTGRLGCVHGDTILTTSSGDIPIRDICPNYLGDKYLEKPIEALTHKENLQLISRGIMKGEQEMYEVELENGATLKCTMEHIFLTNHGWVPLSEIVNNTNGLTYKILYHGN